MCTYYQNYQLSVFINTDRKHHIGIPRLYGNIDENSGWLGVMLHPYYGLIRQYNQESIRTAWTLSRTRRMSETQSLSKLSIHTSRQYGQLWRKSVYQNYQTLSCGHNLIGRFESRREGVYQIRQLSDIEIITVAILEDELIMESWCLQLSIYESIVWSLKSNCYIYDCRL